MAEKKQKELDEASREVEEIEQSLNREADHQKRERRGNHENILKKWEDKLRKAYEETEHSGIAGAVLPGQGRIPQICLQMFFC